MYGDPCRMEWNTWVCHHAKYSNYLMWKFLQHLKFSSLSLSPATKRTSSLVYTFCSFRWQQATQPPFFLVMQKYDEAYISKYERSWEWPTASTTNSIFEGLNNVKNRGQTNTRIILTISRIWVSSSAFIFGTFKHDAVAVDSRVCWSVLKYNEPISYQ